jgi:hypothetical protein
MRPQVLPSAAHGERLNYARAYEVVYGTHALAHGYGVGVALEAVEFLYQRREESLEIGSLQGGIFAVLEEVN